MRRTCQVRVTPRGMLALRLYFSKGDELQIGTRLEDSPANRKRLEARRQVIQDEMDAGIFDFARWFPDHARATQAPKGSHVTVREWAEETWLPSKLPPIVRKWQAKTYRKHCRAHIFRVLGNMALADVTTPILERFRQNIVKQGRSIKTARDIIDASFRAMYRDARTAGLVTGDPFAALIWPRLPLERPDPFSAAERDLILDFFRCDKRLARYYAFIYTAFWTGMRLAELIGLRWGDVDLTTGRLSINRSRTLGEDNAPKTSGAERTITLRPEVVEVFRAHQPENAAPRSFVFTNKVGNSIAVEDFTPKHWRRALEAVNVRHRKLYATRHTFISLTLGTGVVKIKKLADYCGTSVTMIERHYARWMQDETAEEIAGLGGAPRSEPVRPT